MNYVRTQYSAASIYVIYVRRVYVQVCPLSQLRKRYLLYTVRRSCERVWSSCEILTYVRTYARNPRSTYVRNIKKSYSIVCYIASVDARRDTHNPTLSGISIFLCDATTTRRNEANSQIIVVYID